MSTVRDKIAQAIYDTANQDGDEFEIAADAALAVVLAEIDEAKMPDVSEYASVYVKLHTEGWNDSLAFVAARLRQGSEDES